MKSFRQVAFAGIISLCFIACKEKPKTVPVVQPVVEGKSAADSLPPVNDNLYPGVDVSPMDMSYFPVDYPKLKISNGVTPPPLVRVIYSRPHLQRRRLFHDILKYDEPWRLGANESTEIQFFKPAIIQKTRVAPGRYILYCLPHPGKWTIVLNSNVDSWGLKQDSTKDVHRFQIPVSAGNQRLEYFTMLFEKSPTGTDLVIAWEDVVAKLPIAF
jgi:hypothetical protein